MTNFTASKSGRDGARLQDPLAPWQVALGIAPSTAPWLDVATATAARALGLPKAGGLFGSGYAQFMRQNAPLVIEAVRRHVGLEPRSPQGEGQRPSVPVAAVAAQASVPARPVVTRPSSVQTPAATSRPAAAAPDPNSDAAQLTALKAYLSDPEVEGFRDHVYLDSRNIPTTGVGHKVRPEDKLKVGEKVEPKRLDQFFQEDAGFALKAARAQAAEAGIDDPAFITALGSVNFQLGGGWTKEHKNTWGLIKQGDYAAAADEAARSDWNKQTPKRVAALQKALRALPRKSSGKP